MTLSPGARLGPYEVVELLGAGGMGEVYRARDPRLGRDVAVKVLPEEVAGDAQRLAFFEREARAIAALNHPNILTVHDVGTHEGVPYVVTELLEGENLRELVSRRSPTVPQILSYALQAARGLEAAHAKDIIHRDLKPENLFLTTDGRVKILDFGLAKLVQREDVHTDAPTPSRSTAAGHVVGTVAYMSPEQARGHPVDARSDVFSFGVVLYELLGGRHPFKRDTAAATLTAIVEETPAALESLTRGIPPAVGGIARRCLEKAREERYGSGHDVVVALEAVLAAPTGSAALLEVEERSPYPGLSSFTEKDASVFFGREREVEELWGRIGNRRLLAVIGPSGAGKTSFVRAGVVASRPDGWAAIVCTPGTQPFRNLGQALAPELAGDPEALRQLLAFEETDAAVDLLTRWRRLHAEALVVVDQFEELYTLNSPEVQGRFAGLLARLAREADVHVVLSLRDDFLIRCHEQPALARIFEHLTPLLGLTAEGLQRALAEPAKKQGYRFEDDSLVDEMVQAVEGARAALPLLAFAVSRLWEKRDRERKVLTRAAYEEIGGVAGALAQHAEATMDRIGSERQGLVREVFRNLVTAQGTRVVIDREELLSAFPEREGPEEVLGQLIDARLLTSYEVEGKEDEPSHHRIEVVHESLLKAWPRLVRWQTQDEDGAQLRDQLKQAAHLWEEKGRTPDLLWSGTAFREYELWRERYPGKLTALEEDFSGSMVERARRRRRLRQVAVAGVAVASLTVAAVVSVLWQRAVDSALRAEAARLVALGRPQLASYPTAALAYARKSLEVADSEGARRLAVEALWRAPTARILPLEHSTWNAVFSPDGSQLAAVTFSENILLVSATGETRLLPGFTMPSSPGFVAFAPSGDVLLTRVAGEDGVRVVSLPEGRTVRWLRPELPDGRPAPRSYLWPRSDGMLFLVGRPDAEFLQLGLRPYAGGEFRTTSAFRGPVASLNVGRTRLVIVRDGRVNVRPLAGGADVPERKLASVTGSDVGGLVVDPLETQVAIMEAGRLRLEPLSADSPAIRRTLEMEDPEPECWPSFDAAGSSVAWSSSGRRLVSVWDLAGPPDAEPRLLPRPDTGLTRAVSFQKRDGWLAVANATTLTFWAVGQPWARILNGHSSGVRRLAFTPDSRRLVSCGFTDGVSVWPLDPSVGTGRRRLASAAGDPEVLCYEMTLTPDGEQALWGAVGATLSPLDGRRGRWLVPPPDGDVITEVFHGGAFDRSGRWVATANNYSRPPGEKTLRIWDLASGEVRAWPQVPEGEDGDGFAWGVWEARSLPDGGVLTAGHRGIRRFDPETGASRWIWKLSGQEHARFAISADGARLVGHKGAGKYPVVGPAFRLDPDGGGESLLASHGSRVSAIALDATGEVLVTGDEQGAVRVGRLDGGEPHLLLGHVGVVASVEISPDGRWIASASGNEIRLWPTPDVAKPPLHTIPHADLMVKLRSFTNLEVVEDPAAPAGYRLDIDPFAGWKDVPTW